MSLQAHCLLQTKKEPSPELLSLQKQFSVLSEGEFVHRQGLEPWRFTRSTPYAIMSLLLTLSSRKEVTSLESFSFFHYLRHSKCSRLLHMQMAGRRGLATVSLVTKSPGIAPRGFLRLESLSLSLFYLNVNITRVPEVVKRNLSAKIMSQYQPAGKIVEQTTFLFLSRMILQNPHIADLCPPDPLYVMVPYSSCFL